MSVRFIPRLISTGWEHLFRVITLKWVKLWHWARQVLGERKAVEGRGQSQNGPGSSVVAEPNDATGEAVETLEAMEVLKAMYAM